MNEQKKDVFRALVGMGMRRANEPYGDVALSVQAGAHIYSEPRTNDLPLSEYKSVELALLIDGQLVPPKDILPPELAELWGSDTVAMYVPQEKLEAIRAALRERQATRHKALCAGAPKSD